MKESLKGFSAGLLTLAVIGGIGGFLANSLFDTKPKPITEVTSVQTSSPAIETVTVVGNKRTS